MDATTRAYLDAQFLAYAPFPINHVDNGQLRVKLKGYAGETNWLNITPEQAKAIERILLPLENVGTLGELVGAPLTGKGNE